MRPLLVLRPEPGASASARRALAMGLSPVVAPLFVAQPIAWEPPDPSAFQAILFTSANGARHAGDALARYRHLPTYAVGDATAAAVRDGGFADVTAGTRDAEQLLAMIDPGTRILHLCGEHRHVLGGRVHQVPVYTARAVDALPPAVREAVAADAVALLHSPRAAALFAAQLDSIRKKRVAVVAISPAAAQAAGPGWRSIDAAADPTDAAMLAIARVLCENDAP